MSRQRNSKAENARREELARARGFPSAYEQRIRGGATASPSTPRPTGRELARARGHAGARDLLREIQPESLIMVATNLHNLQTDDEGKWVEIPLTVVFPDGEERDYWLTNITDEELDWLVEQLDDFDVDYSPDYDLRAIT